MTMTPKHSLLVVVDESDICDSIHDLLRRDFRVLKVTSALDGIRLMQEEEVHIIMTDQRMPGITSDELLVKVKAGNPYAVRLLFTGYDDLESIITAVNQGHIYHFLKKPWQPEELLNAVRQVALEYDRLISGANGRGCLWEQLNSLRQRVPWRTKSAGSAVPCPGHAPPMKGTRLEAGVSRRGAVSG